MTKAVTYERVLVPTDGSEAARTALDHAIEIATRYGADLHGVYVADVAALGPGIEAGMVYEALEDQGEAVLDELAETATGAGVDGVETSLLRGTPHRAILDYVAEQGIDLVVMGTHGRRGLERYLLGSVTEKVVRLSDVPVLTVHADASEDTSGEGEAPEEFGEDGDGA